MFAIKISICVLLFNFHIDCRPTMNPKDPVTETEDGTNQPRKPVTETEDGTNQPRNINKDKVGAVPGLAMKRRKSLLRGIRDV